MRKVELRMKEEYNYKIIKKLVETDGNKKRVASKLNCTVRTVNRLNIKYKTEGKSAFIHGNRGRIPSTTIPPDTKNKIISLYINEYSNANFSHFCEIVYREFNIKISDTTLNKWLREEEIISPKARRRTKKLLKQQLKFKMNNSKSKKIKNDIKDSIAPIDEKDAHPRRPRSKYVGEMIQMDASSFHWIDKELWHLHVAIDDTDGKIAGTYFDYQETLKGYYNVLHQILTNHGITALFYTDRRTVFEYKRKDRAFADKNTFTLFSYACHNLGIDIKFHSIGKQDARTDDGRVTYTLR